MSLDVSSYWRPSGLTPMGLLQYWPEEVQLFATAHAGIDVEMGEAKAAHQQGDIIVTTHRLVWMQSEAASGGASGGSGSAAAATAAAARRLALHLLLEHVERAELKQSLLGGFGWSTPRVVLHLHEPQMVAYLRQQHALANASPALQAAAAASSSADATATLLRPPAIKSTLPRITRLVFRADPPHTFLDALQQAVRAGVYRTSLPPPHDATSSADAATGGSADAAAASSATAAVPSSFRTTGAGISGIVREAKTRERALDKTLEAAFGDLSALMANAKTIVDLAARLSANGGGGQLDSTEKRGEFDTMLASMGIRNPITHQMAGSAYHTQLAKEMADFLPPFVRQTGGMLLLTDAYCLVNRARGTQLISPQDCLQAAGLFPSLTPATALRLASFPETGVKVIQLSDDIGREAGERIREEIVRAAEQRRREKEMRGEPYDAFVDAPALSPLELSERWKISVVLAKQYLCVAEQKQILCRDESVHGVTFFINQF